MKKNILIAVTLFLFISGLIFYINKDTYFTENNSKQDDIIALRWINPIYTNNLKEIQQLVTKYSLIKEISTQGETPLHYACGSYVKSMADEQKIKFEPTFKTHERPEIVAYLLAMGSNPNAQDKQGWSALHHCTYHGHAQSSKILLENGADPDLKNHAGGSSLYLAEALQYPNFNEIIILMKAKAHP